MKNRPQIRSDQNTAAVFPAGKVSSHKSGHRRHLRTLRFHRPRGGGAKASGETFWLDSNSTPLKNLKHSGICSIVFNFGTFSAQNVLGRKKKMSFQKCGLPAQVQHCSWIVYRIRTIRNGCVSNCHKDWERMEWNAVTISEVQYMTREQKGILEMHGSYTWSNWKPPDPLPYRNDYWNPRAWLFTFMLHVASRNSNRVREEHNNSPPTYIFGRCFFVTKPALV